jgi:hypothetical protein
MDMAAPSDLAAAPLDASSVAVTGGVRTMLRLQGLVLAAVGVAIYAHAQGSWWLLAALFLAPDPAAARHSRRDYLTPS